MRRRLAADVCALWAVISLGCGKQATDGRELARIGGAPRDLQVYDGTLYILSNDENEDLTAPETLKTGPHMQIHAVPEVGGEVKVVARLPSGKMQVGSRGIAFAAKGQLAVLASTGGASRNLGAIATDTSSPVWLDNGVAVLVREKGNCCSIVSVSLSDGGQTPIGTLSGVGEAYVVSDPGQKTYMASTGTGETVAIDPAGKVTPIVGPTLGVVSCVALTTTHLWWGHWPNEKDDRYVISAMPRSGGPVVDVAEFRSKDGLSCSGSATELYYGQGHDVFAVAPGGKPRKVLAAASDVEHLLVANGALFWAEDTGKQWSIRTAPIR